MSLCPLCKSEHLSVYRDKLRFEQIGNVLRCSECNLVFLDQDSFDFPSDFYESQYHQTYLTHVDPDILDPHKHYTKMQKVSQLWVERVNEILTGTETVLDVGCSTGHFMTGIQNNAAKVYGHELSKKEVEFCQNVLKLEVDNKPLSERFKPESMDLITLIFVFEHIGNPVEFLKELKTYLKPNGKLVIVVPNILDPLVSLYNIEALKKFYFCIEHLFYYSPDTLSKTLDEAGFKSQIELVQEYPIINHLNWIYRQKPAETLAARAHVPDVELCDSAMMHELESFWENTNEAYQNFLLKNSYSDRIWCIAEKRL